MDKIISATIALVSSLVTFGVTFYFQGKQQKDLNRLRKLEELLALLIKAKKPINSYFLEIDDIARIEALTLAYLPNDKVSIFKITSKLRDKHSRSTMLKSDINTKSYEEICTMVIDRMKS